MQYPLPNNNRILKIMEYITPHFDIIYGQQLIQNWHNSLSKISLVNWLNNTPFPSRLLYTLIFSHPILSSYPNISGALWLCHPAGLNLFHPISSQPVHFNPCVISLYLMCYDHILISGCLSRYLHSYMGVLSSISPRDVSYLFCTSDSA